MKKNDVSKWLKIELVLLLVIGIVVIMNQVSINNLATGVAGCVGGVVKETTKTDSLELSDDAVTVEFYVMSQCPYGTQVEDAIAPVLKSLGENVDFQLNFIGNNQGGELSSMHGQTEVDGAVVHLCAKKYEPVKYIDLITCMNKNAKAIPGNWKGCAEENGLDVETIEDCYLGEEGQQLTAASFDAASAKGARGSPTIYLNGVPYKGQRTSQGFQQAICAEFADAPEACGDVVANSGSAVPSGNC
ncbi:thioredoxin domain-containing protein [Candidatus Woesearchaeota archaeon]|jgi:hypothetical protein|nr:thioredoxin domain-containing protein [Candidatus Woesearchaeota archaeon]MBT6518534.1 thioredoxin domain-containing protein [Candidatus Woesearchaeota archaeon]MBT7368406.1 thioredoxin domain-containing protein [Candidatus Woesearchaeota archaeon]